MTSGPELQEGLPNVRNGRLFFLGLDISYETIRNLVSVSLHEFNSI